MKISIKTYLHKDIEVLEYAHPKAKKLLFLQHGIHSKKENVMNLYGLTLAKLGYTVVAIDAYKHGVRKAEPFISKDEDLCALDTMNVVEHTAYDIAGIYQDLYLQNYKSFDMIGISMGGLIAYFLSTITSHIDQLVALISSPKFLEAAEYTFPVERQNKYRKESDEVLDIVKHLDPSTKPHHMHFHRLIMMNGKNDLVIPYEHSEQFYIQHPTLPIVFRLYDTEHKINQDMFEDLQDLLKETF